MQQCKWQPLLWVDTLGSQELLIILCVYFLWHTHRFCCSVLVCLGRHFRDYGWRGSDCFVQDPGHFCPECIISRKEILCSVVADDIPAHYLHSF